MEIVIKETINNLDVLALIISIGALIVSIYTDRSTKKREMFQIRMDMYRTFSELASNFQTASSRSVSDWDKAAQDFLGFFEVLSYEVLNGQFDYEYFNDMYALSFIVFYEMEEIKNLIKSDEDTESNKSLKTLYHQLKRDELK